ncbi:hypothetical protein QBC34DRAFT_422808 [Podospora aff. communis PSN243]|uniref:Uncharacterized protein n=1 Tax=Podospora aff. communis PSN243 TaxID=3040156 RepID=A0AAV9GVC7_9PEZI|nr:hypothetical protein QBC34DRAFT_422808 [Podospora aff. communis PSN243]
MSNSHANRIRGDRGPEPGFRGRMEHNRASSKAYKAQKDGEVQQVQQAPIVESHMSRAQSYPKPSQIPVEAPVPYADDPTPGMTSPAFTNQLPPLRSPHSHTSGRHGPSSRRRRPDDVKKQRESKSASSSTKRSENGSHHSQSSWDSPRSRNTAARRDSDPPHFGNILEMAEWIASEGGEKKLTKRRQYSSLLTYLAGWGSLALVGKLKLGIRGDRQGGDMHRFGVSGQIGEMLRLARIAK